MKGNKQDFDSYLIVQKSGFWNMFDKNAIMASSLSKDIYMDIISNYSKYKSEYKDSYNKIMNK